MPPSRWKVVERDRRLVVIDTVTGAESQPGSPAPVETPVSDGAAPESLLDQMGGSALDAVTRGAQDDRGRTMLTTARWYDQKGPRTIRLDERGMRIAGQFVLGAVAILFVLLAVAAFQPWLLIGVAILAFNRSVRTSLRAWTTGAIDRLEGRGPY